MSYLPLLLSQIRKGLLDLILDNQTSAALSNDSLWFSYNGAPLRWSVVASAHKSVSPSRLSSLLMQALANRLAI